MLPGVDGLTLCFEWRQRGITTPILMLTALDTTADKVTGLEMGADDYLVKPFAFEELVARIRSLLRRPREALPAELVAGDLTLDPVSRTVHRGDRPIDLTPKEFALLELLMRHPGQVLTRDQIITNVWDDEFDSFSNVLDVHIANLRHKIRSGLDDLIETVRGVGYRIRTMKARASRPDVFSRASLRLAALFGAIALALVVASSALIFATVTSDLHDAIDLKVPNEKLERQLVSQAIDNIRRRIVIVDGVVIVAIGVLGLWYARRTLRPIRAAYTAQKRFIADASHELRTPLAILKTDVDVALWDEEAVRLLGPALDRDREEIDRMAAMVDDLLLLSRIDARQAETHLAPVDLGALVDHAVDKLRPLAVRRGVTLAVAAHGVATVQGDAAHLERALLNVVKNAVEHSPRGGTVTVAMTTGGAGVSVSVMDEGGGLTDEERDHVFDRFYRTDSSRSRRGGTGLGLSIAQWVARQHGGGIDAVSAPGQGTTMTMSLPLARRSSSSS